jgi:hypothetical protein
MQLAAHALLLASIAAVFLIGRTLTGPAATGPASTPAPVPAATAPKPSSSFATVTKPFGASVRVAPSWEAAGQYNVACGITLPVASMEGGWVKIRTETGAGWIAASRVAVSDGPTVADCTDRRFLYASAEVWTLVPSGCIGLRSRPSTEAAELACVGNGHIYAVVDGPFDPGADQDWFKVTSPTTGTGWTQADNLYPL